MTLQPPPERSQPFGRLSLLHQKLSELSSAWTIDDHNNFLSFYKTIIPKIMDVERCTIYVRDRDNDKILTMFATGIDDGKQIDPPMRGSIVGEVIRTNTTICANDLRTLSGFHLQADKITGFVTKTILCAPIRSLSTGRVIGAVQLLNKKDSGIFNQTDRTALKEIGGYLAVSIESFLLNREILHFADRIHQEAKRFDQSQLLGSSFIAESRSLREVLKTVDTVSGLDINILLQGENGTGKELIARMIHQLSHRADQPFVPVNCACVPENLIESEFFGHEKGAFTDASTARKGRFEEAKGGTLFLDEIGDMALSIQPKFLRAIQEGEGSRLGSNRTTRYDNRLISASNKQLAGEVQTGRFREDLFFRLFSIDIEIPPLRERKDDILPLALLFLEETNTRFKKKTDSFSSEVIELFELFPWPGNVRQLRKEVERLVALTRNGEPVTPEKCSQELLDFFSGNSPPEHLRRADDLSIPDQVEKLERKLITQALEKSGNNKSQTARLLNISRQGLFKKMKRYGIP